MRLALFLIMGLALFLIMPVTAVAEPSISGVSGTVSHDSSVTISGTGFDTKSTAAQLIWDDCDHGQSVTTRWSGAWPASATQPASTPRYAASGTISSVAVPHSNVANYLAARTYDEGSGEGFPADAMVWRNFTVSSFPFYFYQSAYVRIDPSHNTGDNFKWFDYSAGGEPYSMTSCTDNNWYIEHINGVGGQHHIHDDTWQYCSGALSRQSDPCSDCDYLWRPRSMDGPENWRTGWHKIEVVGYVTTSAAGGGYIDVYEDGHHVIDEYIDGGTYCNSWCGTETTGTHSYNGSVDQWSGTTRTIAVGGYVNPTHANNWRFWSDIYLDTSPQRVIIGDASDCCDLDPSNCSVREIQPITAWSDTSVSITVNQGVLANSATAYVCMWDSVNDPGTAYEVTIGAADTTAPTVTSAAVNGTTVTVTTDEGVVATGYDTNDCNLDCTTAGTDIGLTYASGTGTASLVFTSASSVAYGDTCNLDCTLGTDDLEDATGNDMITFSDQSVTVTTPAPAAAPTLSGGVSSGCTF